MNVWAWPRTAIVSVTSGIERVAAVVPDAGLNVTIPVFAEFAKLSVPVVVLATPSVGVAVNAAVEPFGIWPAAPAIESAPVPLRLKGEDAETATIPAAAGRLIVNALAAEAGVSVIAPLAPPELAKVRVPSVLPPTPRVGVAVQAGVAPPINWPTAQVTLRPPVIEFSVSGDDALTANVPDAAGRPMVPVPLDGAVIVTAPLPLPPFTIKLLI